MAPMFLWFFRVFPLFFQRFRVVQCFPHILAGWFQRVSSIKLWSSTGSRQFRRADEVSLDLRRVLSGAASYTDVELSDSDFHDIALHEELCEDVLQLDLAGYMAWMGTNMGWGLKNDIRYILSYKHKAWITIIYHGSFLVWNGAMAFVLMEMSPWLRFCWCNRAGLSSL